jgi:hypothetical protein
MNVLVQPYLDGLAGERLRKFAMQVASANVSDLRQMAERESIWAHRSRVLNGQSHAYEAAARLLVDLRLLKWSVRADTYGLELESPPHPRLGPRTPEAIRDSKDALRRELAPALEQQFSDPGVRGFIDELESPPPGSRRRSISLLIADGSELVARLEGALNSSGELRADALRAAVKPYLQLLPGEGDPSLRDEFTGIPLADIWRYFRYTWSIPQTAIPGRQMFYLVRDRAHPFHAIIGIACLSNSPLMSPERDDAIGWTPDRFRARIERAAVAGSLIDLDHLRQYLQNCLDRAIEQIEPKGLATAREINEPDENVIARLQRRADEFSNRREEALREVALAFSAGVPLVLTETELSDYQGPPVSLNVLELEGKRAHDNAPQTIARQLLVAKKRAFELARLLRTRLILRRSWDLLVEPSQIDKLLLSDEFGFAVSTVLFAAKSNKVGTSILEITTCGAIAPYNCLLGGKLVALLLLSPEVADDYRKRYGDRASIISSQLKNEERRKDCTLAWLNTTSLYSMGSSQYERLHLPAGTISDQQSTISFQHIGDTVGYGTVQFSDATARAVQAALEERHQFRSINNIFGEGFSPKFRKFRDGMAMLGFNPTILMRHDQQRRVYAAPIWPGADAFLRGEDATVPDYVQEPWTFRSATERIAEFWRYRWLASRLNHAPTIETLRVSGTWTLSEQVKHLPRVAKTMKSAAENRKTLLSNSQSGISSVLNDGGVGDLPSFWRDLAQAGPEVCADELTELQLERLHVAQDLDKFLLDRVRQGFSIVLTGNAGDGKTHLLRRLEPDLKRLGAVVEPDATAAMRPEDVSPIIRAWKKASRYCIAANEYPLHLLRTAGKGFAPIDEVNRQCVHRLAYGAEVDKSELPREKVIVIDLSLRNPFNGDFAGPLLNKLLADDEIQAFTASRPDSDVGWNVRHLSNPMVRERLLTLFARLAATGNRTTVRELWIWATRMLLGSGTEDNKPLQSPGRWYSSRLFDNDGRFAVSSLLRSLADPAAHSHPRWDLRLEAGSVNDGWKVDGTPVLVRMDAGNFVALKRRFYFEHVCGDDTSKLDGSKGQLFLNALTSPLPVEDGFKQALIESINRAYCPTLFSQMSTRLFLWVGHRYHEQPSHGYVANQSIGDNELELLRPRLPKRLAGSFHYQPDHLLLRYRRTGAPDISLRIDFMLFCALEKLRQGLPRQLLPDRDVNRLDSFIEQLRRVDIKGGRNFFIHNHDDRTTANVTLSSDLSRYESVRKP